MKISISKEKLVSTTTQTPVFRILLPDISAKTKKFAKPFLLVQMGPRSNLLNQKKWLKILWYFFVRFQKFWTKITFARLFFYWLTPKKHVFSFKIKTLTQIFFIFFCKPDKNYGQYCFKFGTYVGVNFSLHRT